MESEQESQMKAGMVLNLSRFTEWPNQLKGQNSFTIVLYEAKNLKRMEAGFEKLKVQGLPVDLVNYYEGMDLQKVQILFIGEQTEDEIKITLLEEFSKYEVLTISEAEDFAENGGMVRLYKLDKKMTFDVNVGAIRASKLKMSSRVLKLAKGIIR